MMTKSGLASLAVLFTLSSSAFSQQGETRIHLNWTKSIYRIQPDPKQITLHSTRTLTLSGMNKIKVSGSDNAGTGRYRRDQSAEFDLGAMGRRGGWKVLNKTTIQRQFADINSAMLMTVRFTGDKSCTLDVKFLLQSGEKNYRHKMRSQPGTVAVYDNPVAINPTCRMD